MQKGKNIKENCMTLIEKSVKWIVVILSICIVTFLFLQSLYGSAKINLSENITFQKDSVVGNILIILSVILLGVLWKKNKDFPLPSKSFLCKLTIAYICLMLVWVVCMQVMPRADQLKCFLSAGQYMEGEFYNWSKGHYCYIYPNQNGFILILTVLLRIFGKDNWLIIQILNIPALVVSAWACAKTVSLLFQREKMARYTYICLLIFLPMNCYVSFVYGTIWGLMFSSCGIWNIVKYCKNKEMKYGCLGFLLLSCSVICKSNYLIFWVAAILIVIFDSVVKVEKKSIIVFLIGVGIYLISSNGINFIIETTTSHEQSGGIPSTAWVAMGLQEGIRGPGWYNGYNANVFVENEFEVEKTKQSIRQNINERMKEFSNDKKGALDFFARKIATEWNEGTFQGFWISVVDDGTESRRKTEWSGLLTSFMEDEKPFHEIIVLLENSYLSILWLGVLAFLVFYRNKVEVYQLIYLIIFLGGFVFHLFWEAKGQYTVVYVYFFIPYMLSGYYEIINNIKKQIISKQK